MMATGGRRHLNTDCSSRQPRKLRTGSALLAWKIETLHTFLLDTTPLQRMVLLMAEHPLSVHHSLLMLGTVRSRVPRLPRRLVFQILVLHPATTALETDCGNMMHSGLPLETVQHHHLVAMVMVMNAVAICTNNLAARHWLSAPAAIRVVSIWVVSVHLVQYWTIYFKIMGA